MTFKSFYYKPTHMPQHFVTHIYHRKIKGDLKGLQTEIFQIQNADVDGRDWSKANYPNGFTSYGSWDQLHRMSSSFNAVEKKIDLHVERFLKLLDYDIKKKALKMTSLWVNIMPKGSFHTAHIHPQAVISGTYYVSVPKASSAIKFEDPRLLSFMNAPQVRADGRSENKRFVSIQPAPGDLIMFESWLRHEVPLNQSKTPRISVSFNYNWV